MTQKRILHVVNKWERGGVERYVEGVVNGLNREGFDQSILSILTSVRSEADCSKIGPLSAGTGMRSMPSGARKLRRYLLENRFDAVHIHTNNSSGFLYAYEAKKAGVPRRIVHSHNSQLGDGSGFAKKVANSTIRRMFLGSETHRLACSSLAGRHLFGRLDFDVVKNGIDIDKFSFDRKLRDEVRRRLGIAEGAFVLGSVGAMIPAKNPLRTIEVFNELRRQNESAVLLMLGDGELRPNLETLIDALGLTSSVAMLGFVESAHEYYNVMDALIFPSLYEGLPIALVEAQCNGLPIVASDSITKEASLLDSFEFLPLSASNVEWATALLSSRRRFGEGSSATVAQRGFSKEGAMAPIREAYEGSLNSCVFQL